jgi:hypothetical protein
MKLKESVIDLYFNPPTNFYELREHQKLQLKAENFNTLTQSDFVSKTYAQKRYLGWSDSDVMANREFLRKDRELMWELDQISNAGPNWDEAPPVEGTAPAGGEGGGASGVPPEFGPGPTGGEAPAEAPPEAAPVEAPPEAGTTAGTTPA